MTKLKIQEIVVVEGKDDTRRLQEVVDVDTIETIGSAINDEILMQIEHAQETRGVIIFTDPDFSGEKIRKTIMEVVLRQNMLSYLVSKHVPKNKEVLALNMLVTRPS